MGLSNAVLLAQHNEVVGVDISDEKISAIKASKSPIADPELESFLSGDQINLSATKNLNEALPNSDFVVISTPTNYDELNNYFDTSSVEEVISKVRAENLNIPIVVKSTIPVGFIRSVRHKYETENIFFSPEFLREGKALYDNMHPSRIIVGADTPYAIKFAQLLKEGAHKKDVKILLTGAEEAEAIKLFANSYLAMRVAFFNELDSFALAGGMDSKEIIEGVSLDPRIGDYYNNPSFGYGGYCLPKDTKQLLANYKDVPQNIIKAIVEANSTRKDFLSDEIIKKQPNTVGIYRLVMKEGSDNFRYSSVQGIIRRLKAKGIDIIIFEPELEDQKFFNSRVENNFQAFKRLSDLIIANRKTEDLNDVVDKLFTRDLFECD